MTLRKLPTSKDSVGDRATENSRHLPAALAFDVKIPNSTDPLELIDSKMDKAESGSPDAKSLEPLRDHSASIQKEQLNTPNASLNRALPSSSAWEGVHETLLKHVADAYEAHARSAKTIFRHSRISKGREIRSQLRNGDIEMSDARQSDMAQDKANWSPFQKLQPLVSAANGPKGSVPAGKDSQSQTVTCTFYSTSEGRMVNAQSVVSESKIQITPCQSPVSPIPRYRNIVEIQENVLALNDMRLIAWPSFENDFVGEPNEAREQKLEMLEKKARRDLRTHYTHMQPEHRERVLARKAHAREFNTSIEKFLTGVGCTVEGMIKYMIKSNIHEIPSRSKLKWKAIAHVIAPFSEQDSRHNSLVCKVFERTCHYSLWHVLKTTTQYKNMFITSPEEDEILALQSIRLRACHNCQLHDCPFHGEFTEDSPKTSDNNSDDDTHEKPFSGNCRDEHRSSEADSDNSNSSSDSLDDESSGDDLDDDISIKAISSDSDEDDFATSNRRLRLNAVSVGKQSPNQQQSLLDPPNPNISAQSTLSHSRPSTSAVRRGSCSDDCYKISEGTDSFTETELSPEKYTLFRSLLPIYRSKPEGSCTLAKVFQVPCKEIYHYLESVVYMDTETPEDPETAGHPAHKKNGTKRTLHDWMKTETALVHKRKTFQPCNHPGQCSDRNCSCVKQRVACEPSCYCGDDCIKRYRGCSCHQKGRTCFNSASCECFNLNRECNPDLCGTCGVRDVLDPENDYSPRSAKHLCSNCHIQLNKPKRTVLGSSQVAGFGLFVGEPIYKHEYLGEYKGEVISAAEERRRGTMYHYKGSEFLFTLNPSQLIDATYAGNKMRFINHSSSDNFQNCYTKALFCGTVVRMGIFAKRDLHPGEELFFPYGDGYNDRIEYFREIDGAPCLPEIHGTEIKTQRKRRKRKLIPPAMVPDNIESATSLAYLQKTAPPIGSQARDSSRSNAEKADFSPALSGRKLGARTNGPLRRRRTEVLADSQIDGEDSDVSFAELSHRMLGPTTTLKRGAANQARAGLRRHRSHSSSGSRETTSTPSGSRAGSEDDDGGTSSDDESYRETSGSPTATSSSNRPNGSASARNTRRAFPRDRRSGPLLTLHRELRERERTRIARDLSQSSSQEDMERRTGSLNVKGRGSRYSKKRKRSNG